MIKLAYLDEETGWQSTFFYTFSPKYDLIIPEVLPKNVNDIWENVKDSQIVVTDFRLNGSGMLSYTGDDVAKVIHKHNKHLPVLVITSYENNAVQECEETKIIRDKDMFSKPAGLEVFRNIIDTAVNIYDKKKVEAERIIKEYQSLIAEGKALSPQDEAARFDAELYISELDLDSSARANLISSGSAKDLKEILGLAQTIVSKYK